MNSVLLLSDLHLTENPLDDYRWGIFDWCVRICKFYRCHYVFILGDLTQEKDYHSSLLVNRIVGQLLDVVRKANLVQMFVLRGNHDGINPKVPYFRFLDFIDRISFVHEPRLVTIDETPFLMLPHSRTPEKDWPQYLEKLDYAFLMLHATVHGAVSESGMKLDGVSSDMFKETGARIYSGDIHVPQKIGKVEYVGAPYPIRFGDTFKGRGIILSDKEARDVHYKTIAKRTIDVDSAGLEKMIQAKDVDPGEPGDQVKFRLQLAQSELSDWPKYRKQITKYCADWNLFLCGAEMKTKSTKPRLKTSAREAVSRSSEDILASYCRSQRVPERLIEVGEHLLKISHGTATNLSDKRTSRKPAIRDAE
jgi:DNA repair exonuclease SbcCD nuclease subunit